MTKYLLRYEKKKKKSCSISYHFLSINYYRIINNVLEEGILGRIFEVKKKVTYCHKEQIEI